MQILFSAISGFLWQICAALSVDLLQQDFCKVVGINMNNVGHGLGR